MILSAGPVLTPDQWQITCLALHRACSVSLHSLQQLMVAFCPGSHSFYGDVGQVKVAARRDCTTRESERLKQLAQQVTVVTGTKNCGLYKLEMRRFIIFNRHVILLGLLSQEG